MNYLKSAQFVLVFGIIVLLGRHVVESNSKLRVDKNGVTDSSRYWPGGVVPYQINNDHFDKKKVEIILKGLNEIQSKTCVKFREKKANDEEFVYIIGNFSGCWSYVGRTGGEQFLNLQSDRCVSNRPVIHEMLHALGFEHQQCATNRDDYVRINWDNIKKERYGNFKRYNTNDFGVGYEYGSIMHYPKFAFAIDPKIPTIFPLVENATLGGSIFTDKDIQKVRKMYRCGS